MSHSTKSLSDHLTNLIFLFVRPGGALAFLFGGLNALMDGVVAATLLWAALILVAMVTPKKDKAYSAARTRQRRG